MIFLRHFGDREFRNSHQEMCFLCGIELIYFVAQGIRHGAVPFNRKGSHVRLLWCQVTMYDCMTLKRVKGLWIPGWSRDIQSIYTADPILLMSESRTCDVFFTVFGVTSWITSTGDPNSRGDFMYCFLGPWAQVDRCPYCHCLFPLWPLWLRRKVLILWRNTSLSHVEHFLWFSQKQCIGKEFKVVNYVDFGIIHRLCKGFSMFWHRIWLKVEPEYVLLYANTS